jgi:L-lactate dehydrogenase complex protein LldE
MRVKAQLFITCLAEQFFPHVLKDMVVVLERLGVECAVPPDQTCCGQPFYNSGFQDRARDLARGWLRAFAPTQGYIVCPSGSCADMVRSHYLHLFPEGSPEHAEAAAAAARTFEFSQFLVNELKVTDVGAYYPHRVAYHASCHLLRGLGAAQEPKRLLGAVRGIEMVPLAQEDTCCGFGGVFSVVYPEVSRLMMEAKLRNVEASGAEAVVAGDAGCLMNIGGGLRKAGSSVRAMHLIEVLAATEGEAQP